jgi:type IV secretory pathway VirB4 component
MANKLYELLAVEQDRKNKANESLSEAKKIFTKNGFISKAVFC